MIKLVQLPDEAYHNLGDMSRDGMIVSASLLKDVRDRGLYKVLVESRWDNISKGLQKSLNIGTALHSYIFEPDTFKSNYYFGEVNPVDDRIPLNEETEEFIREINNQISLFYPELLESIGDSFSEVCLIDRDSEIPRKAKLDKLIIDTKALKVDIYDLKSTYEKMEVIKRNRFGEPYILNNIILDKQYDLQMAFYRELVRDFLVGVYGDAGMQFEINTHLIFCSTTDLKVRGVTLSEEKLGYGLEKAKEAMVEVADYVLRGDIRKTIII